MSSAFDPSIEQALLPLIGGGATVVISDAVREIPHGVLGIKSQRDRVTFISGVLLFFEFCPTATPPTVPGLDHLRARRRGLHLRIPQRDFAACDSLSDYQSLWADRGHHRRGLPSRPGSAGGETGSMSDLPADGRTTCIYVRTGEALSRCRPGVVGELYIAGRGSGAAAI